MSYIEFQQVNALLVFTTLNDQALIFKHFLRNGAYNKDELINLISKTAFKQYDIKEEGIGFYIYLTK